VTIAQSFGAETYLENVGLGYARQMGLDLIQTKFLSFVDSDVVITDLGFFRKSLQLFERPSVGAVVGMSRGHRFSYGLPAGLLVLRKSHFAGKIIPSFIDARETYYLQARLDGQRLQTIYLPNAMVHSSGYRRFKPEWEGANTRLARNLSPRELLFGAKVILLLSLNSKSLRNLIYIPVFMLKFLRGFVQPEKWRRLTRTDA
jgi:glycosyltransferase involved in cell wall biosynthesis